MIYYFFACLSGIILIFMYLQKQDRSVHSILKHNKDVKPLFKMKSAQKKAEEIRVRLAYQNSKNASAKGLAMQHTLQEINMQFNNHKMPVSDYNTALDRLSRQI